MDPEWLQKARQQGLIQSERYATPPAPIGDLPEPEPKKSKFNNRKTVLDGRTFDSEKEAKRYKVLSLMEACGEISELECQAKYEFWINGVRIGSYRADFRYKKKDGLIEVEDVKSPITRQDEAYRLRKRLLKALHGIDITEV